MRTKLTEEERAERHKLHQSRWYEAHKDQAKAAARRWRETHREQANAASRRYMINNRESISARKRHRKYGLSVEAQKQLLEQQGHACAICLTAFLGSSDQHVDHCHLTGAVRGFLCGPCNQAISLMKDSADRLQAAAEYLNKRRDKS